MIVEGRKGEDTHLVTIITDPLRDYDRGESESECCDEEGDEIDMRQHKLRLLRGECRRLTEEEDDQSGHIDDCFCEEPGVVPVRASSGKMEVHCA